ncbi:MAG: 4Fe-4S dicluster domain-containing protein [Planctomycetes bacterium]|nr:4Fe-4S dicluster domain-containing protein [Planctomycetota bacterium]
MKKPKVRELLEAVRVLAAGPATLGFPNVPSPAPPKARGRPTYHEKDCVGCGTCAEVCVGKAIEMRDEGTVRRLTIRYDSCIQCGQCQAWCITGKGIRLEPEYDLTTYDRESIRSSVEKELVLCEGCGAAIACADHLAWVAERLGSGAFANPTLALAHLAKLGFGRAGGEPVRLEGRGDRMRVLCARCRRPASLI